METTTPEFRKRLVAIAYGSDCNIDELISISNLVEFEGYLNMPDATRLVSLGVPILKVLSKSKTIPLGKLQEVIAQKAITFGDFKRVIETMTDRGGIFFKPE